MHLKGKNYDENHPLVPRKPTYTAAQRVANIKTKLQHIMSKINSIRLGKCIRPQSGRHQTRQMCITQCKASKCISAVPLPVLSPNKKAPHR